MKSKQGITKRESKIAKGTAPASKIPIVIKDVYEYLTQCNDSMEHKKLLFQEFEKPFKTLKRKKATGCDGLNGNILRLCKGHCVQNFKGIP